ncbi:MAG: hypothetical protein WKF87_07285 [Chryseolinea sp.]
MMRCLLFSGIALLAVSCVSEYQHLIPTNPDTNCALRIVPRHTEVAWYNASVDVVGKHISGLVLIKHLPDSSWRVVFTNEAGVTFFDIGYSADGDFKTFNIIRQLNRKAVISILRKDFELIIGLPFRKAVYTRFDSGDEVYYGAKQNNERAYFITSKDCASLRRVESGSARKRLVSITMPSTGYPAPARIEVKHHTFNMHIGLTRIQKNDSAE